MPSITVITGAAALVFGAGAALFVESRRARPVPHQGAKAPQAPPGAKVQNVPASKPTPSVWSPPADAPRAEVGLWAGPVEEASASKVLRGTPMPPGKRDPRDLETDGIESRSPPFVPVESPPRGGDVGPALGPWGKPCALRGGVRAPLTTEEY